MTEKLKSFILNAVVTIFIAVVITNVVSYLRKPDLGSPMLPYFTLQSTQGKPISSETYIGKPLVLHFWATWCPTCKIEASAIESLSKSHQVLTIAVNSGNKSEINSYLTGKGYTFDVVNDIEGRFAAKFDVNAFPTTIIYDKENAYVYSDVGYTSYWGLKLRLLVAEFF